MSHTIATPTEIESPFYEAQLQFTPQTLQTLSSQGHQSVTTLNSLAPVVTLGQPQYWNMASLAREKGKALPADLGLLLRDANFYLLQLACSFRPERDTEVAWARLNVYLRPKTGQEDPIAFDLYPRESYNETKTDWKVGIAPSLKFAAFGSIEAEGKLGEMVTTIEFRKLEPVVVGYGLLQPNPAWDFEKYAGQPLRGIKSCYVIIKKPHSAEAVRMTLDIIVEVSTRHGLFSTKIPDKDRALLSQVICKD